MNAWIRMVVLAAALGSPPGAKEPFTAPPPAESTTVATRAARARSRDDMLLRQYSWTSWVQMFKGGVLANQVITRQSYLPNGRLQKVVTNKEGTPLPNGFVAGPEADYLTDLEDLLELYRPTSGALMNFLTTAKVTGPDTSGALIASARDVVKDGDSITAWLDAGTTQLRRIRFRTTFDREAIEVNATFAILPNGPTYLQYAQVDLPAKGARLLVHHYDYVQTKRMLDEPPRDP